MDSMTLVGVIPRNRLVLDDLDLGLLLFFLVVIDTGGRGGLGKYNTKVAAAHIGPIKTLILPCVKRSMWVVNSVLKTQLRIGSPSSVGPRFKTYNFFL